jgi:hypothetical protein
VSGEYLTAAKIEAYSGRTHFLNEDDRQKQYFPEVSDVSDGIFSGE